MGLFSSAEQFEKVITGFFNVIAETPKVADELMKSKIVIRFTYTDPDVVVLADCSGNKINITSGDTESKAEVDMWMSADIAHKFWFGKVNLMAALTRKQMTAKGPVPKILSLLPAIKPTYEMYPEYLDKNGYGEFNIF